MKIYTGLDYTHKRQLLIKQCITQAKENPFTTYYIITKDVSFVEESFLQYTEALFNIEILTLSTFIRKHTTTEVLPKLEKILVLKSILEKHKDSIFYQPDSIFETITSLLPVFDAFYYTNLHACNTEGMTTLSQEKLQACFTLYQEFQQQIPTNYAYSSIESLSTISIKKQVFYILEDVITNQRIWEGIQHLDTHNTVYIVDNASTDARNLNQSYDRFFNTQDTQEIAPRNAYSQYITETLFSNDIVPYTTDHPFSLLVETNPIEEVKSICYHIFQTVIEEKKKYSDFMIYYPNPQYLEILQQTLEALHIPHNNNVKTKENMTFKTCIALLNYVLTSDEKYIVQMINHVTLKKYSSFIQANYVKKQWLEYGYIQNEVYQEYKQYIMNTYCQTLTQENTVSSMSEVLINFIQEEIKHTEESISCLSIFSTLVSYTDTISLNDYRHFIETQKPSTKITNTTLQEHVYLCSYEQPYSGPLTIPYIYITGMNETIVPKAIKNQGIILNHERQQLHIYPTINEELASQQNHFLQILTGTYNRVILSYAMIGTTNETLLPSSYMLHLKELFIMPTIHTETFYNHPALAKRMYILGGRDTQYQTLNTTIDTYIQNRNQPDTIDSSVFSNTLSASQIETYNGCPYKYYCQYGLRLQPLQSPTLQPNEIGNLIHYVLETARHFFASRALAKQEEEQKIKHHIDTAFSTYLSKYPILYQKMQSNSNQYFLTCMKEDVYTTILILKYHMQVSSFHVESTEEKLEGTYGDFILKGFVDRLDVASNYMKVIDYKSSNKDIDFSLALQGFNIQMLLYIDMLSKTKQLEKGAFLYFNTKKRIIKSTLSINEEESVDTLIKQYRMNGYAVEEVVADIDATMGSSSLIMKAGIKKDGTYKGNVISSTFFDRILEEIAKHISILYQELTSGNITIAPKGSNDATIHTKVNPCTYCSYRSICNLDVFYNTPSLVEKLDVEKIIGGKDNG